MPELRGHIDELVELMDEYNLESGELAGDGWAVSFSKKSPVATVSAPVSAADTTVTTSTPAGPPPVEGMPVTSPMAGIFYSTPNPGSPPYVKEGDTVEAGSPVGLIEAMKVFNDIYAPISGTVKKIVAENGQLVQPGEPLVYIG